MKFISYMQDQCMQIEQVCGVFEHHPFFIW